MPRRGRVKLNYGSPGIGTGGHLVTELMLKRTGIEAVHVPYQATTQQMLATAGGHLDFTFDTVGNAKASVESGKITALAVSGKGRAGAMPDMPSFGELGIDGLRRSVCVAERAGARWHAEADRRGAQPRNRRVVRTSRTSRTGWRRAPTSPRGCRRSRCWRSSTRIRKTGRRSLRKPACG